MKRPRKRWLGLIMVGAMTVGIIACAKKESVAPSDPTLIVLDDCEIRYNGSVVMQDVNHKAALVMSLEFTNNSSEAISYIWAVSEKAFQDGIGLDPATVPADEGSFEPITKSQLTEIQPGKTIEVRSAYILPDSEVDTIEIEFSQLSGKKKGELTIELSDIVDETTTK